MKRCPSCQLVFPDESSFCFLCGNTLEPGRDPLVGTTLAGRFRIEQLIHEGPWAKLYTARYRLLAQPCMVKVLTETVAPQVFDDAVALARRCTHRNVSELIAGGRTNDGQPFLVQPVVEGTPLSDQIARGTMPLERALGIGYQLLQALARIHDFGSVHGNLRPSNVILSKGDHVTVVDVGLGRSLMRDPWDDDPNSLHAQRYMAPELSSQQRSSSSADLYACGVIIFELLTGSVPFEAGSLSDLRSRINDDATFDLAAALSNVAAPICKWLGRLLSRVPSTRQSNAHQALVELQEACTEANVTPAADPGATAMNGAAQLDASIGRWQRFGGLFTKMLEVGFPSGAPEQTHAMLTAITGRVSELGELGTRGLQQHNDMDGVLRRAREGRKAIAEQMDALNDSAKSVRKELYPLRIAAERHGEKVRAFPDQVVECHREVTRWEGRSGFTEPYQQLAAAYRQIADLVDKWWGVRNAQLTCEREVADKESQLVDVDAQLEEFRQALRVHESNLSAELEACQQSLAQLGTHADKLELELLDLASRFSAPLRSKPELGACFRELTQA